MISESEKEGHAMWKAFVSLWKNIFNYKGKSGRKEFWLGIVMNIIMMYAGLIPVGEEIIAIGGRGHGVDSAVILTPANAKNLFDLEFHEIIAMPRD